MAHQLGSAGKPPGHPPQGTTSLVAPVQFPVSQAAANENNAIQLNRRGRLVQVKFTRWCEIPVACKPRRARWQALRRGQALKQRIGGDCRRSEPLLLGFADVAAQQLHIMHCPHPISVERIHWRGQRERDSDQTRGREKGPEIRCTHCRSSMTQGLRRPVSPPSSRAAPSEARRR